MNKSLVSLYSLIAVIIFSILLLVPTIFKSYFENNTEVSWPISKPLSLGLDLVGGGQVLYEVDVDAAVAANAGSVINNLRSLARKSQIAILKARVLSEKSSTTDITASAANLKTGIELIPVSQSQRTQLQELVKKEYPDLVLDESPLADAGSGGANPVAPLRWFFTEVAETQIRKGSVDQALQTLRNRIDQFGVAEPLIQRVGAKRILLQLPGVSDVERIKRTVGSVARLEFRLIAQGGKSAVTKLKSRDPQAPELAVENDVLLGGEAVSKAQVSIAAGAVDVSLKLTPEGARLFYDITREHQGRQLAIILDNVVYSAPRINEPIPGGQAQITGGFSIDEATQLAIVLRSGALPAPLKVLEERSVGPTLGADSIKSGVEAIIAGFIMIMFFMVIYYKKAGVIATVTLALNLLLMLAGLSLFGATLTLPGLAGLALTVGMAVDSNVLIFERIRDELKLGVTGDKAIAAGFDKAWSAILDTNLTGLLSGILLYILGTGPVKGFAVTLSIGVLSTMFCAVFATKTLFSASSLVNREKNTVSI